MASVPFDQLEGHIWMNGEFVKWAEAKIHVLTHGLHYASAVFEGERAYGGEIFKLTEHTERLHESARILGFTIPYSVAEIDDGGVDGLSGRRVEDQAYGVLLSANAQGMDLELGPAGGNGLADLEHMGAQHLVAFRRKVVGIVLHEGCSPFQIGANDFHGAHQGSSLPVAFAGKAVAVGHEPLDGQAGQLLEPIKVLKVGGKSLEVAFF